MQAFVTLVTVLALAGVAPASAQAHEPCTQYVPDIGVIQASRIGTKYYANLEFLLTEFQVQELRCRAEYLEIDFQLYGFNLWAPPTGWQDYQILSNLPGAIPDTSIFDPLDTRIATVTGVRTADIQPNKRYFALAEWEAPSAPLPRVLVRFAPSRWVNIAQPWEWTFCQASLQRPEMCIFGLDGIYISEISKEWFGGQYPNGRLPFYYSGPPYIEGDWSGSGAPTADRGSAVWQTPAPPIVNLPPQPVVKSVKRTTDHIGTRQVYAATNFAVTEAWWRPGEGVNKNEMIFISQGNIVGFDKVNEPDGITQSLYTAVPDGVWETWWRPNEGKHHNKIVTGLSGVRQVIADPIWEAGQYTHRLYVLAQDGPYEVWWRDGGDGVHVARLNLITQPVTMAKSRGPDGADQLYVATPTYVYELWWRPGTNVHHGEIINISQGDIRSLSKGVNLPDGGQLFYTGTSTTAWQSYWLNSAPSHGTIATGQSGLIQLKKTVYGDIHQLYFATGSRVYEYWWNGPNSGNSELIHISQNNITSFDKSNDGADQQVYTASGNLVYETWWRAGVNPTSNVLFSVVR